MNNEIFQQAEQFFKPMTEMVELNARTFEALAEKQTGLMSDVWNDGLNYARDLSEKRDVESFYASQKDFWETVNQKFSSTARDSYALLSDAQEKMSELVHDSISSVDIQAATESFMQAAQKAQGAAQGAAQDTAKAASKTAQKAQAHTSKGHGKASESGSSNSSS